MWVKKFSNAKMGAVIFIVMKNKYRLRALNDQFVIGVISLYSEDEYCYIDKLGHILNNHLIIIWNGSKQILIDQFHF